VQKMLPTGVHKELKRAVSELGDEGPEWLSQAEVNPGIAVMLFYDEEPFIGPLPYFGGIYAALEFVWTDTQRRTDDLPDDPGATYCESENTMWFGLDGPSELHWFISGPVTTKAVLTLPDSGP